ncbi:MAG: DUF4421 domain-containing protein [Paludibacteraceae bacterium]|nr:DUF4421 domain-containing protein [Paludibacteraceae bacterium]
MKRLIIGLLTAVMAYNANAIETKEEIEGYEVLVHPDTTLAGPFTKSTPFIAAQQPHPMFEIGYRYRIPYVGIYQQGGPNLHCDTEMQPLVSVFMYWKWLKLGWNFALQNINKGFNFGYAINMGRMNLKLDIAHIRNLRVTNTNDFLCPSLEDETRLRGLTITDYDLGVEWTCNKNYALLSGYDYSYHRTQLRGQGTGILAARYTFDGMKKRDFEQSEQANHILDQLQLNKAYMHMLNVGGGYGYNAAWSGGRWVLGMICVPYLSGGLAEYNYDHENHQRVVWGLKAHGRVNLTYNYRYGGLSLSGEYNGACMSADHFGYRRDVANLRINHVFRLGEMGVKSGKVPGHKVMDNIQQMLTKE